MKKLGIFLVVALVALQGVALAATVEGTVKSVDATAMKLEVSSGDEVSSVTYNAETKWPEGVTDPSTLVDKEVTISTDDVTGVATSVEEATEEVAAPAAPEAQPAM